MIKTITFAAFLALASAHMNEVKIMPGHKKLNNSKLPQPHEYIKDSDLPTDFFWGNVNGVSYLTKSLNQHIPQYCGSCWAHGAISALGDRIKIARNASGVDVNLAIQYILNCGAQTAGSCHGGSHSGTYEFIQESGFVPYDTCMQYAACSAESSEGLCQYGDWTCSAENTCRTCSTFSSMGGSCVDIDYFPNATVAEYGTISGETAIMKEIYARGPVAAGVDAVPLHTYTGGIATDTCNGIDHIVSIVGWGVDNGQKYWITRNSWGEFWGEMGYFRSERGTDALCLEDNVAWATPGSWTEMNVPCYEDGSNCDSKSFGARTNHYIDPALKL